VVITRQLVRAHDDEIMKPEITVVNSMTALFLPARRDRVDDFDEEQPPSGISQAQISPRNTCIMSSTLLLD